MKRLNFVFAAALIATIASPVAAQYGSKSYEFLKAVRDRDGTKATELLKTNPPSMINLKDEDGNTPLIIAIARKDDQWTSFMINHGADVNLPGKNGDTPVIVAARAGFRDAAGWLITAGAKVDAANRMGETALIVATQARDVETVRLLLRAGADPDKTDSAAGLSARDYATRDNRSRQILQLIEAKKPKDGTAAR